jgi:sortase A
MFRLSSIIIFVGLTLFGLGFAVFALTYIPLLELEVRYELGKSNPSKEPLVVEPKDKEFGIVIPKIGANASVIGGVNPVNPKDYQLALTRGVAHAATSALPGSSGNMFIFSHSSANFYMATRYNSVFYLLNKLERGDKIDIYYKGQIFVYEVTGKEMVAPTETKYMRTSYSQSPTLTLMTCWPPGTNLKRLLVVAKLR